MVMSQKSIVGFLIGGKAISVIFQIDRCAEAITVPNNRKSDSKGRT